MKRCTCTSEGNCDACQEQREKHAPKCAVCKQIIPLFPYRCDSAGCRNCGQPPPELSRIPRIEGFILELTGKPVLTIAELWFLDERFIRGLGLIKMSKDRGVSRERIIEKQNKIIAKIIAGVRTAKPPPEQTEE